MCSFVCAGVCRVHVRHIRTCVRVPNTCVRVCDTCC